ncbi:MAG TPA: SRPBCC domain-containing protein [Thermoplasmata archaeon]|nr:SRPBCC domain-containing protein [Thermoplasmata archaeon]
MNPPAKEGSTHTERNAVTVTRDYDFPRESVFRMLTDRATASRFFTPEGAEKLVFEWDPRPGGTIRIHDRHPDDGVVYKTSGTIVEFVPPEILGFRSATAPGDGNAAFEALQTVRFESLGPRKTRVIVQVKVLSAGSFPGGNVPLEAGFRGGWGQTLDILQRALEPTSAPSKLRKPDASGDR